MAALLALPLAPSRAAAGGAISVTVFASPTQVLETQNVTMTALLSNAGKVNATAVQICLIAPPHWNASLQGSSPIKPEQNSSGCVQYSSSASSRASARSSASFTLPVLQGNETEFLQFQVKVPAGTPAGPYTLLLLAASPEGDAQGNAVVQSQAPASLPFGSVLIPVSLALILFPGFLTLAVAFWMNKALSTSWQTSVIIALLSFAFGYAEWAYFSNGVPSESPLSSTQILTLDPTVIQPLNVVFVVVWSLGIGLLLGATFYFANVGRGFAGDQAEGLTNRIQDLRRGYIENAEPTWRYVLETNIKDAIDFHGGGWAPRVEVTLSSSGGQPAKSPPGSKPPTVTVKAAANEDANDNAKAAETLDPTKPDKSVVSGLLRAFDPIAPFDIMVSPQYTITIDNTIDKTIAPPAGTTELKTKLNAVFAKSKKWETSHHAKPDARGGWVGRLNNSHLPRDSWPLIREILKAGGERKAIENDDNISVKGRTWIKGSEIVMLRVFEPMRIYVFVAKDPKRVGETL